MANHMEAVTQIFNVKLNEEFHIHKEGEFTDRNILYRFTRDGLETKPLDCDEWLSIDNKLLTKLLTYELSIIKIWKPKKGEHFYVPAILDSSKDMVAEFIWDDNKFCKSLLEKKIVFTTREEAIYAVKKMLELIDKINLGRRLY